MKLPELIQRLMELQDEYEDINEVDITLMQEAEIDLGCGYLQLESNLQDLAICVGKDKKANRIILIGQEVE